MKGYISFILFFILGFLVLYPIIFYKHRFSLWPSFVVKETTIEHILQKRSIETITKQTFGHLRILVFILKNFSDVIENLLSHIPVFGVVLSEVFDVSSYQFREFLVKTGILLSWSNLANSWKEHSNYTLGFNCFSYQDYTIHLEFFKKLPDIIIDTSILACYFNLEYEELAEGFGKISVNPFSVYTKSKLTNVSAQSTIEGFEVY